MINFDEYTNENTIKHNPNWLYIPDHPYRILIIGGSGSGKTNALLNLIQNELYIDHTLIKYTFMQKTLMKLNINF